MRIDRVGDGKPIALLEDDGTVVPLVSCAVRLFRSTIGSRCSTPQDGLIPPPAPQLGATRVCPGQLPLVKSPLNWTHAGHTQRCPCAHAIADAGGLHGRRTSLGYPRNVRGVRRVFQAQRLGRTSEEH